MITEEVLTKLYIKNNLSMKQIAKSLNCSTNKVVYWMDKYQIKRRSISEAVYIKAHPDGDPFKKESIDSIEKAYIAGLGVGLYWGEGVKANKYSVRLGNSDPVLINSFIKFLECIFNVKKIDMKFGLQIFTDIDIKKAILFWSKEIGINRSQFYKPHVTISGSIGTYRHKSKYGVLTVYYNNKKLRDEVFAMLPG